MSRLAIVISIALTGAAVPAGAFAGARLAVQVLVNDKSISITEVLSLESTTGGSGGPWEFPLLMPESGPTPTFTRRSESAPDGIEINAGPGTKVAFDAGGLVVAGDPSVPGGLRARARYTVEITSESLTFKVVPDLDVESLQFITRRNAVYGMQLRPLLPYSYREEVEEDGTWQYMSVIGGVERGSEIRVVARHLARPFHWYRAAGIVSIGLAVCLVLVGVAGRRRGRGP